MTKKDFLELLRVKLKNLPKDDIEERVNFYSEMIDDRIEDGYSEEDAIKEIGNVDDISREIISKTPLKTLIKEKTDVIKKKYDTKDILLLVLGFPLWFPLLVSVFVVILSLYISIWAVLISLYASALALAAGFIGGLILGIVNLVNGGLPVILGFSIASGGLAILLFFGCLELTKLYIKLTKKMIIGVKYFIVGKER